MIRHQTGMPYGGGCDDHNLEAQIETLIQAAIPQRNDPLTSNSTVIDSTLFYTRLLLLHISSAGNMELKDLKCSQKTTSSVKAQDDTGNGCGIEIPGDTVAYQGKKINLVMKKHKKRSLDTKCGEGGQLLVCEAVTGPLLVPESCIGMTTNIYPKHTSGVDPCHNKYIDETNDIVQCRAPF
ncbi:unnamed protein product [Vicia faba]|uniref:Uncharacterized protein n=1 Tax=Vicia faba TaxID=3906 RepID=A0AAV0YRH8_VICFA|nr:unnamed protein product [Vicia faba]